MFHALSQRRKKERAKMNDTQTALPARFEEKPGLFTLTDWYQQHAEPFQIAGEEAVENLQGLQFVLGELQDCCETRRQADPTMAALSPSVTHAVEICQQAVRHLTGTVLPLLEALNPERHVAMGEKDLPALVGAAHPNETTCLEE
jgi:hypothetical protein